MTPGSGIRDVKKSGSVSGIRDEQPGSYFLELRNHFLGLHHLNSLMPIRYPGSGMEKIWIWDPGWNKVRSGIRDREKHPGSATLHDLWARRHLVLRIRDILVRIRMRIRIHRMRIRIHRMRIRIPGSVSLTNGSKCRSGRPKIIRIGTLVHLHHSSKIKSHQEVTKQ